MTDIASDMETRSVSGANEPLLTSDGVPLKQKLARTTRRMRIKAFLLTVPLVLFLIISFVVPIGQMLFRSVYNTTGTDVTPNFAVAIQKWDGKDLPSEEVFELFVKDILQAQKIRAIGKTPGKLGTRVNYELPGSLSLIRSAPRKLQKITEGPYKEALLSLDKRWENPVLWRTLKRVTRNFTPSFYLAALDLKYG